MDWRNDFYFLTQSRARLKFCICTSCSRFLRKFVHCCTFKMYDSSVLSLLFLATRLSGKNCFRYIAALTKLRYIPALTFPISEGSVLRPVNADTLSLWQGLTVARIYSPKDLTMSSGTLAATRTIPIVANTVPTTNIWIQNSESKNARKDAPAIIPSCRTRLFVSQVGFDGRLLLELQLRVFGCSV